MDLSRYQELTGVSVATGQTGYMTAQLARAQSMLETMLGFTLTPDSVTTNLYNELGKSQSECACPSVGTETLDDPDDVIGSYRLFDFNGKDQYLHVDPFTTVHKVKLVYMRQGEAPNGVTIRTLEDDNVRVHLGRDGWGKYIERCRTCVCVCDCHDCIQLAVDADWLYPEDLPDDLSYVLADMVTFYSDLKRNIRSETITTHSYTKFSNTAPELEPSNLSVIKKYAGPGGSVTVQPTW